MVFQWYQYHRGIKIAFTNILKWLSPVNKWTNIYTQTNSSSCVDLFFTDQPILSANSGVNASLHSNCHHQVLHFNFNFDISYPSPYEQLIWDYKKADSVTIRKVHDTVNSKMWKNYHNKEQPYTNLQLSNRLFQVFFFSVYTKWLAQCRYSHKKLREQFQSLKVGYHLLFVHFQATCTAFLTYMDGNVCLGYMLIVLMSIDFDTIYKTVWTSHVLVVWTFKIHQIIHFTAIVFPTIPLMLWIV